MAKGNKSSRFAASKINVEARFTEMRDIFLKLKEGADDANMPLLAKNIDLSVDILNAYKRAFLGLKIGDR